MYKLIRDNIPELIKESGGVCDYAVVQNNEFYTSLLKDKLIEEVNEYLFSPDSLEELADIKLVIEHLIGSRIQEFQHIYDKKLVERGGFDKRYVAFFADTPTQENK